MLTVVVVSDRGGKGWVGCRNGKKILSRCDEVSGENWMGGVGRVGGDGKGGMGNLRWHR